MPLPESRPGDLRGYRDGRGLDVKQFDRIDLGGFGDSIADSSVIISPAQQISSP